MTDSTSDGQLLLRVVAAILILLVLSIVVVTVLLILGITAWVL